MYSVFCFDVNNVNNVVLQGYSCVLRNMHANDCDQTTRIITDFTVVITLLV